MLSKNDSPTAQELFDAILEARQRVYEIGSPTPLEEISAPDSGRLFIKREDLSPINAYKWRGAYNRMAMMSAEELKKGVVCASAGNHAQGVALASRKLDAQARIFMPRSTPQMKQDAVRAIGGDSVEVILHGDSYDAACEEAMKAAGEGGQMFVHPYDDLAVMAGQGTMADEIVMSGEGPFDRVYLQIGGGGMAAGVACWLKRHYPDIEVVGVEGVGQASMSAAMASGAPATLDYLDIFCDGTAVKRVGALTSKLCAELVDRFITVTNEEVCAAIQLLWETRRLIPEPSGALGLAAWMKEKELNRSARSLAIVCGANMDFGRLAWIVRHAGIGSARRKYYRFFIPEKSGSLLHLLDTFLDDVNIIEFQHGIVSEERAAPVIGVDAMPQQLELLERKLTELDVEFEDATGDEDVEFRIIHYDSSVLKYPCFILIEFPERPGALYGFLRIHCQEASIAYFNYGYTGERVGRALVGFDFESEDARGRFRESALADRSALRFAKELSEETMRRIV